MPGSRPDLDNFIKAALDGCNEIVFRDDSLVVTIMASKRYSDKPALTIAVELADSDFDEVAPLPPAEAAPLFLEAMTPAAPDRKASSPPPSMRGTALAREHNLPICETLTERRRARLIGRLKDTGGIEGFTEAIERIPRSGFLLGKNDRGWRANFDWLLQPDSFAKLREGTYDDPPARVSPL